MKGEVTIRNFAAGNDVYVLLDGAQSDLDGTTAYLNAAQVAFRVHTLTGVTAITAQTMNYVTSSNGKYEVLMDYLILDAALTKGVTYKGIVTAAQGGENGRWEVPIEFDIRRGLVESQTD